MKNVCLKINIQSTKWLARRERIKTFCDTLRQVDPTFVPKKLGSHEPLRQAFDINIAEEQISGLQGENGNLLFFSLANPLDGVMYLSASRGTRILSNGIKVEVEYGSISSRLNEAVRLLRLMFRALDASYACATLSGGSPHVVHVDDPKKNWGEINGVEVPPWNPSGLQSLPGICWINVFGPEYVRFIGEDVLASLPAQPLSDGSGFWLQPTERPEDMLTFSGRALAADIKNRIGKPLAFYGHDPLASSFRATYDAPLFDLSEIRQATQSA